VNRPLVDLRLEGVTARDEAHGPVEQVDLYIRHGEFFTIVGSPRSGKSMLLRLVAGFAAPSAGRVLIDGEDVGGTPPGRRDIGFVFQDGALWPHLDVFDHVAFGLRARGTPREEVDRRVPVVLGRLGLTGLEHLRPDALTLDQRRRLALARALAVEPRVLLLDEPLAHLEPAARKALRLELARLHRDLAVTTLHATRDAADALALSDRIGVLVDGRLRQVGDPPELYWRPRDRAVAEALGPANLLPVKVVEVRDTGVVVESPGGSQAPIAAEGTWHHGARGLLCMRPESLGLVEAAMARGPGFRGTVALRVFEGTRHMYEVDIGGGAKLRVELPAIGESHIFRLGDPVRVEVSSETAVLLPDEGEPASGQP
jgi:ABC-type Fe3+/spermidine/putrescine transport system ATPase subunit